MSPRMSTIYTKDLPPQDDSMTRHTNTGFRSVPLENEPNNQIAVLEARNEGVPLNGRQKLYKFSFDKAGALDARALRAQPDPGSNLIRRYNSPRTDTVGLSEKSGFPPKAPRSDGAKEGLQRRLLLRTDNGHQDLPLRRGGGHQDRGLRGGTFMTISKLTATLNALHFVSEAQGELL
ncbi:hypothetical protein MMC28_003290 [Mycoblastus sanguinarius]|nr:hypothetical protein [Mycoblastus sanguinarius]